MSRGYWYWAAVELGHRGPVGHQGVQVGVAGEAVGRHEAPQAVAEAQYAGHPQLLSQEPAGRGEYLCEVLEGVGLAS